MNIEIVEFYPIERDRETLTGTMRIKLPDIGIHILGVFVSRRKDSWFFSLPGRNGIHHETSEPIRYPVIVFEDREKQRQLMAAIREQGPAFIEKRLADTENPLSIPQKSPQPPSQVMPTKARDNPIVAKKTASVANPKLIQSTEKPNPFLGKTFIDPPKRKMDANGGRKYG